MRKHTIMTIQLAICAVLLTVFAISAVRSFEPTEALAVARRFDPPTMTDVDVALHRIGIRPETLAAAGGNGADVTTVVDLMHSALTDDPGLLESVDLALEDAQQECDRLTRLVRSGQASQQEIDDCQAAIQDLAAARVARDAVVDDLFADIAGALGQTKHDALAAMRSNSEWRMPVEFLVLGREEPEWLQLRQALANERIAANYEDAELDQADQTFLTQERSRPAIAVAKANYDANLAVIEAAWEQATSE